MNNLRIRIRFSTSESEEVIAQSHTSSHNNVLTLDIDDTVYTPDELLGLENTYHVLVQVDHLSHEEGHVEGVLLAFLFCLQLLELA